MHLDRTFPQRIELGAVTVSEWGAEEIRTDGGWVVRNQRWSSPLVSFEISMPIMRRDDVDYLDLIDLWEEAQGTTHSFNYVDHRDESDATIIAVRFATPLRTTAIDGQLEHVDTFTLEQVRLGTPS